MYLGWAPCSISNNQLVGWVPAEASRYSYWYQDGANALGVRTTITQFNGSSLATIPCDVTVAPVSGGFAVAATPNGFTASANGNIDGDAACDHWFINDQRNLQNPNSDVNL